MSDGTVVRAQGTTGATVAVAEAELTSDPGRLLSQVVCQLEDAGHKMVAHFLESASAVLQNDELKITVQQPPSVIELMMGPEQRRVANAAAGAGAGRAVKVSVASGTGPANGAAVTRPAGNGNAATARGRAAEDPVVQRMQEKFRAEIRTVIDHRDKS